MNLLGILMILVSESTSSLSFWRRKLDRFEKKTMFSNSEGNTFMHKKQTLNVLQKEEFQQKCRKLNQNLKIKLFLKRQLEIFSELLKAHCCGRTINVFCVSYLFYSYTSYFCIQSSYYQLVIFYSKNFLEIFSIAK